MHQKGTNRRAGALLLPLCFLAAAASAAGQGADDRVPLIQIDLTERAPAMVGAELGRAYAEAFPGLERRWDSYLYEAFAASGGDAQARFDRLLETRIEPLRAHGIAPDAHNEIKGLGSTWALVGGNRLGDGALSRDEFWAAQLLADLGMVGGGVGYAVFDDATVAGGPIVGRNRDALIAGAQEPPLVITVRRDGPRRSALIGFAGQVAPPLGMNDRGLFVAHLPVPASSSSDRPGSPRAIGFALRQALQRESRVAGVADALSRQRFTEGHAVLIADPDRAAVLEQMAGATGRLRTDASPTRSELAWGRADQIAAVDCFALERSRDGCLRLLQRYRWERLRTLARFKPDGPRARADDVAAVLLDPTNPPYGLLAPNTREVLIYEPRDDALYLRTRSSTISIVSDVLGASDERASASTLPLYRPLSMSGDASGGSNPGFARLLIWGMLGLLATALVWTRLRLRLRANPDQDV